MMNFQEKVYAAVKGIPAGRVLTYGQVAQKIGRTGSARAVGNALNKNRDKNIPCHRVVRSDGRAGGYNRGVLAKIKILRSEGLKIRGDKIII